jgi:AI-2 transport protein TqsA
MVQNRKEETNWLITVSLVILAVVALAAALIYTRKVMMPFVVSLFIVALVSPIQDFQVRRLKFPRVIAVLVTLLVVLSVIALASLCAAQSIRTIAYKAGEYSASFNYMANKLLEKPLEYLYKQEPPAASGDPKSKPPMSPNEPKAPEPAKSKDRERAKKEPAAYILSPVVKNATGPALLEERPLPVAPGRDSNEAILPAVRPDITTERPGGIDTKQIAKDLIDSARQVVKDLTNQIFNILRNTVGAIFGLLSAVLLICLFVVFLLAGRNPYAVHSPVYSDIVRKIRRYLGTKVLTSALVGVLVWASLALIGLELADIFGVLAFLVNFIPVIGPIIVTLLPIPIAVAQFQSPWPVVLAVAVPSIIHNVIGNILEPKLMGEGLDLHPVTIMLALSFWGLLWGIVGMFLATPITAAIRIVMMQFDTLRPIANLLAGDFSKPPAVAEVEVTPASSRPEGTESAGSLPK